MAYDLMIVHGPFVKGRLCLKTFIHNNKIKFLLSPM